MKEKRLKVRLPQEAYQVLRHKGGAQGTSKGKRGYHRNASKQQWRKEG